MRFYDLTLTPVGQTKPVRHWSSFPNGKFDPGAQNIIFDIPVAPFAAPVGGATITIEGIPLQDLTQALQYGPQPYANPPVQGMILTLKGGMGKGLPLANPKQAGVILSAQVFQSWGNWQGTEMNLNFVVQSGANNYGKPTNIVLNWVAGTPLAAALAQTFSIAYPNLPQSIQISPALVLSYNEIGHYRTLAQLATTIQGLTNGFFGAQYTGVQIAIQNNQIIAFDGTSQLAPTTLDFSDFMGQPMWLSPNLMQVKLVMRADIKIASYIRMPAGLQATPGIVQTTAASLPSYQKYKSAFQGQFYVRDMRHIGNLRAPVGDDWVTILNCVPVGNG